MTETPFFNLGKMLISFDLELEEEAQRDVTIASMLFRSRGFMWIPRRRILLSLRASDDDDRLRNLSQYAMHAALDDQ